MIKLQLVSGKWADVFMEVFAIKNSTGDMELINPDTKMDCLGEIMEFGDSCYSSILTIINENGDNLGQIDVHRKNLSSQIEHAIAPLFNNAG